MSFSDKEKGFCIKVSLEPAWVFSKVFMKKIYDRESISSRTGLNIFILSDDRAASNTRRTIEEG